jgi:hypothetical protein
MKTPAFKTYLPIVVGKGLNKTGYVLDRYPGEIRSSRGERVMGEFTSAREAYWVLWAHFKHVSAGLKSARKRSS